MKTRIALLLGFIFACGLYGVGAHAGEPTALPTQPPVSATMVVGCDGNPLITIVTYADGTVVRITKSTMYGFKDAQEVADYGNRAEHNAIQFNELCQGLAT